MLQAVSSTTATTTTATASANTVDSPKHTEHNSEQPIVATPEEKSQRRRSTFYVPLVIEDEEEETKKKKEAQDQDRKSDPVQKSSSNTSLSSTSNSLTHSETKSAKGYSLRKSSSVKSGVAKVSALFERKTPSKMSPPCGFNWSISGSENTAQYSDSDEDEENSSEARHREQLLKSLPTNSGNTASPSKLKRYGIVLNVISLNGSDNEQSSLGSMGMGTGSTNIPPGGLLSANNQIPNTAPRSHFNEENDIVLATPPPPKQQALSTSSAGNQESNNDYDDDSEISRMQTNTSTPIKLMKSRSRTNILAVPLPSVERGLATNNANNNNNSSVGSGTTTTTTTTTTTLITLRAKSKTLPQNLSPSVVLREAAALDELEKKREKYQEKQEKLQEKQRQLFGGSTVSQIGSGSGSGSSPYKLQNSCSATSILTHSFPPKNLFLLKSTPKLSTDIAVTPPTTSAICSPPKKSLSFIRRAHSTKVARSNSLLKPNQTGVIGPGSGTTTGLASINSAGAMQQGSLSSSCAGDSSSNNGSWGKHFYQPYDVCPLSLDELNCYFQADHCEELICERFKIRDLTIHMASASATGADLSVATENETTATAEDDAGHHSGRSTPKRNSLSLLMGTKYFLWQTTAEKQPLTIQYPHHFIPFHSIRSNDSRLAEQWLFVSKNSDRIWYSPIYAGSR